MHPGGVALSDVWKALPLEDNYTALSAPVLDTVLRIVSPSGDPADASALNGLIGPRERVQGFRDARLVEPAVQY